MGREIKRVPLDFDAPLKEVWHGYLMPDRLREETCPECQEEPSWFGHQPPGDGLTPEARAIANTFYPHQIGGPNADALAWCDKLGQAEVEMLIDEQRIGRDILFDRVELDEPIKHVTDGGREWFERYRWDRNDVPAPTAAEVNAENTRKGMRDAKWSGFMGHDGVNRHLLIRFRCKLLGITMECPTCQGHSTVEAYPGQRAEAEAWEPTEPPAGEGYQLWETTSEGAPVGPVFKTAEDIARWLGTTEGGSAIGFGHSCTPMAYEEALGFVQAAWAPSMIAAGGVMHDGAAFIGSEAALGDRD